MELPKTFKMSSIREKWLTFLEGSNGATILHLGIDDCLVMTFDLELNNYDCLNLQMIWQD